MSPPSPYMSIERAAELGDVIYARAQSGELTNLSELVKLQVALMRDPCPADEHTKALRAKVLEQMVSTAALLRMSFDI